MAIVRSQRMVKVTAGGALNNQSRELSKLFVEMLWVKNERVKAMLNS
jgi:hypothetical protein